MTLRTASLIGLYLIIAFVLNIKKKVSRSIPKLNTSNTTCMEETNAMVKDLRKKGFRMGTYGEIDLGTDLKLDFIIDFKKEDDVVLGKRRPIAIITTSSRYIKTIEALVERKRKKVIKLIVLETLCGKHNDTFP